MATKQGSGSWKKERTTGRKYSGGDQDTQPAPGERNKFWVSGYTRADGRKIEGYWRSNPAAKDPAAHR
jgi:hypothetical protein